MATPSKSKSLSAEASRLAKKATSAPQRLLSEATEAVEATVEPVESAMQLEVEEPQPLIPPALDVLIHETADTAISGAKDAQENLRCATEEALVQTRAAYDKLKHVAEEVTDTFESSYVTVTRGFGELNQKAIEGLKAQADANFEHFKALAAAKSLPEAFTLQTDHARKQFEVISSQMTELATLAQKVVVKAAEPLKSTFDKSLAA